MKKLSLIFCLLCSFSAHADFTGIVVKISDGDTIKVLDDQNVLHKIRLIGIDAPEKKQEYGLQSSKNLSDMIIYKTVTVQSNKSDRYGRELGQVFDGDKDINIAQVNAGMAWFYKAYERALSSKDRSAYAEAETFARGAHYGLWSADKQIPPWDFRKGLR